MKIGDKHLISIYLLLKSSGQWWIRTTEGKNQQIYSLPHLATLETALSFIISLQSYKIILLMTVHSQSFLWL